MDGSSSLTGFFLENDGVRIPRFVIQDVLVYIRCCDCSECCITSCGARSPPKAPRGCQEGSPVPLDLGTTTEERGWLVSLFYHRPKVSPCLQLLTKGNPVIIYNAAIVWNTLVALTLGILWISQQKNRWVIIYWVLCSRNVLRALHVLVHLIITVILGSGITIFPIFRWRH